MPIIDYDPFGDGETLDAAALNDRFTEVEDGINDIPASAVQRGGLKDVHLPSILPSANFTTGYCAKAPPVRLLGTSTITAIQGAGGVPNIVSVTTATPHGFISGDHVQVAGTANYDSPAPFSTSNEGPITYLTATTFSYATKDASTALDGAGTVGGNLSYGVYKNSLPLTGSTFDYQNFSATGPTPVYGPPGGVYDDQDAGWRILAYNNVIADAAEVVLASAVRLDAVNVNLEGIIVRGSYNYKDGRYRAVSPGLIDDSAMIAIGWQDGSANYHVLERSVRFNQLQATMRGDIVTSTLLTQADLDGQGDGTVVKIFVVVASEDRASATTLPRDLEVTTYNITTIPLHAAALPAI